jgi:hypothetical protein
MDVKISSSPSIVYYYYMYMYIIIFSSAIINSEEISLDKYEAVDEEDDDGWDDSTLFASRLGYIFPL